MAVLNLDETFAQVQQSHASLYGCLAQFASLFGVGDYLTAEWLGHWEMVYILHMQSEALGDRPLPFQ